MFSLLAYIWMYIVLQQWTEGEITIPEALITFFLFFVLIGLAFLADRLNSRRKKRLKKLEDESKLPDASHPFGSPRSMDSGRPRPSEKLEVERLMKLLKKERQERLTDQSHEDITAA